MFGISVSHASVNYAPCLNEQRSWLLFLAKVFYFRSGLWDFCITMSGYFVKPLAYCAQRNEKFYILDSCAGNQFLRILKFLFKLIIYSIYIWQRQKGNPLRVYMDLEPGRRRSGYEDIFISYHAKDDVQSTYAGALFHNNRNYQLSSVKNNVSILHCSSLSLTCFAHLLHNLFTVLHVGDSIGGFFTLDDRMDQLNIGLSI